MGRRRCGCGSLSALLARHSTQIQGGLCLYHPHGGHCQTPIGPCDRDRAPWGVVSWWGGANLNILRYVDTFEPKEDIDIAAVQQDILHIEAELVEVQAKMVGYLKELGIHG